MKTRMIFLITVLAVMFGGTSAVGLADDDMPEANTGFVAQVSDESLNAEADPEAETLYIQYHVCSLDVEAADYCDETLDDFDPDTFEWVNEIAVDPNEEGEFNHGSFVSAFAQGVETNGPGKGCLMRFVAQSDWGKPGVESSEVLEEAEIFCAFNKNGEAEIGAEDDGDGPPPWAGIGKKKWEAGEEATSTAGGPPPWAKKGSDD